MIRKLFSTFENEKYPSLGPTLWGLNLYDVMRTPNESYCTFNLIYFGVAFFICTQYIELWLIRSDIASAFHNLSITLQSTLCITKIVTLVVWQKRWSEIINYVSCLELSQLSSNDGETKKIIAKYTKYSRIVTYFYWTMLLLTISSEIFLTLFTVLMLNHDSINATIPHIEILSSWTPFDRTQGIAYWVMFVLHSMFSLYTGGISAFYDTNIIVLMNFFAGQLKVLKLNCSRLFEDAEDLSNEESLQKIKNCHDHHLSLYKHCQILNSVLSPVQFLYVIICSLMICTNAVQFTSNMNSRMECVRMAVYISALVSQLFLYCWHSNEVLVMSEEVDEGVYMSDWWTRDVTIRRCVLLLGGQLRRTVYFAAGPFVYLNVPTFIAIMKASYSYYTLLSQK